MVNDFKVGCVDCKNFSRGYSDFGGYKFVNDKMIPRKRVVKPKCSLKKTEFQSWLQNNKNKRRKDFGDVPKCFVMCSSLKYVLDDLERNSNEKRQ